jgi:hypothetical protein
MVAASPPGCGPLPASEATSPSASSGSESLSRPAQGLREIRGGGAAAGAPANTLWPPAQGLRDISDPVTLPAAAVPAALAPVPAPPPPAPPPGDGDVSAAAAAAATGGRGAAVEGGRGAAAVLTLRPPAQGYQSRARRAGKRF